MAEYIVGTDEHEGHWMTGERIVRCRDCSYYGEGDYMDSGMVCWIDKNHAMPAQPDGFCAWGEVSGNG